MPTQNSLTSFFNWESSSGITQAGAGKYPNPFCDIASEYVPSDLTTIFEWCEYLMLSVTPFRAVAQRVVRYFLTELVLEGQSDDERDKYDDFLNNQLHILQQLAEIGDDYLCLHGDTHAVTRDGVFKLRDLEGKTVDVLSEGGVYRPATFKKFGRQELMEVTFTDGRTVLATPEHEWVAKNCSDKLVRVPTTTLRPGYQIERTVAPRPEKNAEFREGVRHGFVFGDGSTYNKTRKTPMCVANFFGVKDAALLPYFEGVGGKPHTDLKRKCTKIHGLPARWKQLPANDASASYWYGFVCGFLAADGSVDVYGCPLLTQVSRSTLETVASQLPRIGMVAGPIREYDRESTFTREDGSQYDCSGKCCVMSLFKRFMRVEDLIIESHIHKFNANKSDGNYGRYIGVKSVTRTGIVDDVYCCVEMKTHTFVIDQAILTGNCYGQSFVSIYFPFDRFLICPHCGTTYHIATLKYKFDRGKGTFKADCGKCHLKSIEMRREDRRSPDTTRVRLIRWNPKEIKLRVHPISGKIEYYMHLDSVFVGKVLDGDPFYLNETPWGMVDACLKSERGSKDYLFKFKDDSVYHMRCSSLAGLPIKGWAIPPILPNFKLAYYVQLLRRYDEAIALDFIIPFRILFPNATPAAGQDALSTINMASFVSHMQQMVNAKRKNLTDIQVSPFSIGYEMLGGEAKSLAPKDNIALAVDELLNAMGFPADLYKGSLSIQAFPVALRLFEKQWNSLVDGYDDFLAWMLKRLSRHFMWGEVTGSLRSVTLADDIELKALSLQGAAAQDISKQTAYRPLGLDFQEEQRRVIEEQEAIQQLQQEAMLRQQAQAGATSGGGSAGGGAGGATAVGATPGDVYEQAKALAQQLLIQTPETMRRGELIKIKHSNPTLHALVMQEMDTMRQDMSRQGQAMVMQQMKTGEAHEIIGYGPANSLPSVVRVGLLIADQLTEYNKGDLMKIAMDIKEHVPLAKEAFHYVYSKMLGWS